MTSLNLSNVKLYRSRVHYYENHSIRK